MSELAQDPLVSVTIAVFGTIVGALLGVIAGWGGARRKALDAMSKAFSDVRPGPSRLACITLRMRWQRIFDGDEGAAAVGEFELDQIQDQLAERHPREYEET